MVIIITALILFVVLLAGGVSLLVGTFMYFKGKNQEDELQKSKGKKLLIGGIIVQALALVLLMGTIFAATFISAMTA